MPITSPDVITFSNDLVRRTADRMTSTLAFIDEVVAYLDTSGNTVVASLGSDTSLYLDDGSYPGGQAPGSPDGRDPITVGQVLAFIAACRRLKAQSDSDIDPVTGQHTGLTSRSLFGSVAVNPNL